MRLVKGPASEFGAGDSGGEAEIVFDLGARSGLSARRLRFDHQRLEPFGRRIDGGCEPGGAGADDEDIAHLGFIDAFVEAEALGDLAVRRVAKHGSPAANQHRQFGGRNVEAVEQMLGARIALDVDVLVRISVAGEELPHAQRLRRVGGTDESGVPLAASGQFQTAQNERAHQNLAQVAIGLHQRLQGFAAQLQHLAVDGHARAYDASPPG